MPLSEVLAMYGYESGIDFDDTNHEVPENDSDSSDDSPQLIMENPQSPRIMTSQLMQSHSRSSPDGEPRKARDCVSFYNSAKYVVDVTDQLARKYSVKSGSRRWQLKVCFFFRNF